jgi:transposase
MCKKVARKLCFFCHEPIKPDEPFIKGKQGYAHVPLKHATEDTPKTQTWEDYNHQLWTGWVETEPWETAYQAWFYERLYKIARPKGREPTMTLKTYDQFISLFEWLRFIYGDSPEDIRKFPYGSKLLNQIRSCLRKKIDLNQLLNSWRIKVLKGLLQLGYSEEELSKLLGFNVMEKIRTVKPLQLRGRPRGRKSKPRELNLEAVKKLMEMREAGMSIRQIAKRMGISKSTVQRILSRIKSQKYKLYA